MKQNEDGITIPKNMKYSTELGHTIEPLRISNSSNNTYVFKIRTNQKTVISLHSTHGFFKPNTVLQITVKMIQKPDAVIPLKLEINYAIASPEDIQSNDSKKAIIDKKKLTKRVITLQEVDKKSADEASASIRAVQGSVNQKNSDRNGFNEDDFPLDSSIKRQESQHCFTTVEVTPFASFGNIIRAPTKEQHTYSQPQHQPHHENEEDIFKEGMFRHTFSIDKPVDAIPPKQTHNKDNIKEGEVKMNMFEYAFQTRQINQQPEKPQKPKQETPPNPFAVLMSMSQRRQPSPAKQLQKQQQLKKPQRPKQATAANPFDALMSMSQRRSASPAKELQRQQQSRISKQQGPLSIRQSHIIPMAVTESKIFGEDKERQQQLHDLVLKIECHKTFIADLQSIPIITEPKKYPKVLFIAASMLFFLAGGVAKWLAF